MFLVESQFELISWVDFPDGRQMRYNMLLKGTTQESFVPSIPLVTPGFLKEALIKAMNSLEGNL